MLRNSKSCSRGLRIEKEIKENAQDSKRELKKSESQLMRRFTSLYKDVHYQIFQNERLLNKRKQLVENNNIKKQLQQMEGCTFIPNIKNNYQYTGKTYSFLQREQHWKKNLDRKLEEKREQKKKKQQDGLTFQPLIISNIPRNSQTYLGKGLNYERRINLNEKKSYKTIHITNKKLEETPKITITHPTCHIKLSTDFQSNKTSVLSLKQMKSEDKKIEVNKIEIGKKDGKNTARKQNQVIGDQGKKQNERSYKNIHQIGKKRTNKIQEIHK